MARDDEIHNLHLSSPVKMPVVKPEMPMASDSMSASYRKAHKTSDSRGEKSSKRESRSSDGP